MAEWIGRTLSKVEIQRLLGHGGMADVYLGLHTTLNRPVAVKILHSHLVESESLLGRFRAEAQAVAGMRHPHIVQVLDFDVVEDRPYIVMELLEGMSLREYMATLRNKGKQFPHDVTAWLIAALANALDYAHARGIVHRDVKPANVMLRREGGVIDADTLLPGDVEVVLTDFGVARMADATVQTASGVIVGTPAYMSPEQVRGESVDARSDIYSLGIMLYEMLSGTLPFDGDTQASILIKQISEPPPPLPGASPELQAVIDRALAKDPAQRFQRASDLALTLEAALGLKSATGATEPHPIPLVKPPASVDSMSTMRTTPTPLPKIERPTGAEAISQPPVRRTNPLLWIGGIAAVGLVLLVGLIILAVGLGLFNGITANNGGNGDGVGVLPDVSETQEATEPTEEVVGTEEAGGPPPTPTVDTSQPVGGALLRDNTLILTLSDIVPPPDGFVYQAWLTEPGGEPLDLGVVEAASSEISLNFTDPSGKNLITEYSGFTLSIEPASDPAPAAMSNQIAYTGEVPEAMLSRLRLMFGTAQKPLQQAILDGMSQQVVTYDAHITNTINAINSSDLNGSKLHAEHVINIVVGTLSEEYGEYDGNGRAENPGDGVGLATYLLLLQETAQAASNAPGASADIQALADNISEQVEQILQLIENAKNDERSITAADTVEEIRSMVAELATLKMQPQVQELVEQAGGINVVIPIEVFPVAP